MNTFQIVMLGLAGLLVGSIFWEQLKSFFSSDQEAKVPTIITPKVVKAKASDCPDSLVEVVAAWDNLKRGCEKHNLMRAVKALKTIFPLLVIEEGDELNDQ